MPDYKFKLTFNSAQGIFEEELMIKAKSFEKSLEKLSIDSLRFIEKYHPDFYSIEHLKRKNWRKEV